MIMTRRINILNINNNRKNIYFLKKKILSNEYDVLSFKHFEHFIDIIYIIKIDNNIDKRYIIESIIE